MSEFINKPKLVKGAVYEVQSRNLIVAAYDGDEGFVGIREKFDDESLFKEYLARKCGGVKIPLDTVYPVCFMATLDEGIKLDESLGTVCVRCGKPAWWTGPPAPAPWTCESGCDNVAAKGVPNTQLFDILKELEKPVNDRIVAEQAALFGRRTKIDGITPLTKK